MKLAFAGKGGVGKTTLVAWTADYLARAGYTVWMVDADTALSLGQASGLSRSELPLPLIRREDIIRERIGSGTMLHLNPEVSDLPEQLAVPVPVKGPLSEHGKKGQKFLLVMGSVTNAGGGCACEANALLKALLAHLVLDRNGIVLVDLEAGVEHLGRGTVAHVDGVVVVSEPSYRGLETAAEVGRMSTELGLTQQVLALNRCSSVSSLPELQGLPSKAVTVPYISSLAERQLANPSVVGLSEQELIDRCVCDLLNVLDVSL